MSQSKAHPILIISPRWRTRALLAGELGERLERDVIPAPGGDEALRMIKLAGVDPSLLVVEGGPGVGPANVERLLEAKREVPVVLVVGALREQAYAGVARRCAATLTRPVRIGTIAEVAGRVLKRGS